jgi:hypothetical protein
MTSARRFHFCAVVATVHLLLHEVAAATENGSTQAHCSVAARLRARAVVDALHIYILRMHGCPQNPALETLRSCGYRVATEDGCGGAIVARCTASPSGTLLEARTGGPDRELNTADDVVVEDRLATVEAVVTGSDKCVRPGPKFVGADYICDQKKAHVWAAESVGALEVVKVLLNQQLALPGFDNGHQTGFTIIHSVPQPMPLASVLRKGDTVLSVNDVPLHDVERVRSLVQARPRLRWMTFARDDVVQCWRWEEGPR